MTYTSKHYKKNFKPHGSTTTTTITNTVPYLLPPPPYPLVQSLLLFLYQARLDHAEHAPEGSRRGPGLKRISVVSTAWLRREADGSIRVPGCVSLLRRCRRVSNVRVRQPISQIDGRRVLTPLPVSAYRICQLNVCLYTGTQLRMHNVPSCFCTSRKLSIAHTHLGIHEKHTEHRCAVYRSYI